MSRHQNDFNITPMQNAIEKQLKSIPKKMGRLAADHFDKSFVNQGFTDTTLQPWKKTKSGKRNAWGVKPRHSILIQSGRLRRGIRRAKLTNKMVQLVNDVPYAKVHNEGFKGKVKVSGHNREVNVYTYNYKTRKRSEKPSGKMQVRVKAHTRNMNLPRRRFMAHSRALRKDMEKLIIKDINSAIRAFKPF